MNHNKLVLPVVKWVGGKRQLLSEIKKYVPDKFSTYYEPFVGGGAVLFFIQPKKAIINDINPELINLYEIIRDDVEALIKDLKKHKNEADYFYELRELDRDLDVYNRLTAVERASRIHYLNKTCFNGLFRVNNAGQFNTPFGRYSNPNITNEVTLRAVSKYFNQANIRFKCGDFTDAVKGARKGSFVYFDPPYDPISASSNFTGYSKGGFDRKEQLRLRNLCDKLDSRGIKFLLSNSSTEFIHEIYNQYNIEIIKARRVVNAVSDDRGEVDEVLIRNY